MRFAWLAPLLLVACGNEAPVADGPGTVDLSEDDSTTITLTASDDHDDVGDLQIRVTTQPENGSVDRTVGFAPLSVTYTPDPDFNGTDTLTFVVDDSDDATSSSETVTFDVAAVNDAPVGNDDTGATDSLTPLVLDVLANDTDVDADTLFVASTGTPTSGTVTIEDDDTLTFTPAHPSSGEITFTYDVSDGAGGSDSATVTVTVTEAVPVVIDLFTADPTYPVTGDPVTLTWAATAATECTIDQGVDTADASSGAVEAFPTTTTTWTLTCQGSGGPVTATADATPYPGDADGDRLNDLGEIALGTDDEDPDSDDDGLPDGAERRTDPLDADTDDDGWSDGLEDLDRDGVLDPGELDPADPDSDGDGTCDGPRADSESDGVDPTDACADPAVWYVDAAETGSDDGTSWDNAFDRLQEGLDAASAGDHVWVAAGTYKGLVAGASIATVPDGVHLLGGFTGDEASALDRPDALPDTVLDGDFDGDGMEPTEPDTVADNSETVLQLLDGDFTVDGFVIQGGKGREKSVPVGTPPLVFGGVEVDASTARLSRLVLQGHQADEGAALGGDGSLVILARSVVRENNEADAAIQFTDSSLVLVDLQGYDNAIGVLDASSKSDVVVTRAALHDNASIQAVVRIASSDGLLYDVDFVDNTNTAGTCCTGASALSATATSDGYAVTVLDTVFARNDGGSGAVWLDRVDGTFTHAVFVDNTSSTALGTTRGGAITHNICAVVVKNSILQFNDGLPTSTTDDVVVRGGDAAEVDACLGDGVLGGQSIQSDVDPFEPAASGEWFLDADGLAVDAGDSDAAADTVAGYPAVASRVGVRTTALDLSADDGDPDLGRHYRRDRLVIRSFSADATDATWDVANAASCVLVDEGGAPIETLDAPTTGATAHGQTSGAGLGLECTGTPGELPATASAFVP